MLECHACLRQCVRALISTHSALGIRAVKPSFASSTVRTSHFHTTQLLRQHAVTAAEHDDAGFDDDLDSPIDWPHSAAHKKQKDDELAVLKPRNKDQEVKAKRLKESYLQTELKYLKDPAKLADHVKYVVGQGDEEKALALVRLASKSRQNTVSWNHIIDWQMKKGKTKGALDTYNDMKKRAQQPDSHTMLLILRGLANFAHHPQSLARALSIYHATSRLPGGVNIMHTNAVVKVCARANDMDSLWDIVSKLPESGPQAADHWTFTTILYHMRHQAITGAPEGETTEEMAKRRELSVVEGRKLWSVIVKRWRAGDLLMDEDLVAAMGRLLLQGSRPRDWDDVLSLVQQTMQIPRLVPRLGTAAREQSGEARIRAPDTPDSMKNDNSEIVDPYDEPRPGSAFDPITSPSLPTTRAPTVRKRHNAAYAAPSNNTLSLILEACLKTVLRRETPLAYWDTLTDTYGVRPDLDNAHMLLRIHRHTRASTAALSFLLTDLPRLNLTPIRKTFRLAMSACVRDAQGSPHALARALDNAARLLSAMHASLPDPDAKSLALYLELAVRTHSDAAILAALDRLAAPVANLQSLLSFGRTVPDARSGGAGEIGQVDREDAVLLMRRMQACYDRMLDSKGMQLGEGGVERAGDRALKQKRKTLVERRHKLEAFITREANKKQDYHVDWAKVWERRKAMREGRKVEKQGKGGKAKKAIGNETNDASTAVVDVD